MGTKFTNKIMSNEQKNKCIHRVKIIKGHIQAIQNMIEQDNNCIDIIHQSIAVQKSLKKLDQIMLNNHVSKCLDSCTNSNNNQKIYQQIIDLYKYK